jgi:hypothetical protein
LKFYRHPIYYDFEALTDFLAISGGLTGIDGSPLFTDTPSD